MYRVQSYIFLPITEKQNNIFDIFSANNIKIWGVSEFVLSFLKFYFIIKD